VNSAALGGRGVDSIGFAMRMMGRHALERWLSLMLLTIGRGGGEMRTEVIKGALQRGRMCELIGEQARSARLARAVDLPSADTLFMVGLLSCLDALLGLTMSEVLQQIELAVDAKQALLGYQGRAGSVLEGVVSYFQGEWEPAEAMLTAAGANADVLGDLYLDSVAWAGDRMAAYAEPEPAGAAR
jgi:EAL and modified HD-GYP domain-containing signal transduction protein